MRLKTASAVLAASVLLASCWGGAEEGKLTYQEVTSGHVDAVFANVSKLPGMGAAKKLRQASEFGLSAESVDFSGSLTASLSGATDFSSGALSSMAVKISAAGGSSDASGSAQAELDMAQSGPDQFVRVRSFSVNSPSEPQMGMMADAMKGMFLDKWIKLPSSADALAGEPEAARALAFRDALLKNPAKLPAAAKAALKESFPLAMDADRGYASGAYNYDVSFSGEKAASAASAFLREITGTGLTADEQASVTEGLSKLAGKGTLSVDGKDMDRFSADLLVSEAGDVSGKAVSLKAQYDGKVVSASVSEANTSTGARFGFTYDLASKSLKFTLGDEGKMIATGDLKYSVTETASSLSGPVRVFLDNKIIRISLKADSAYAADDTVKVGVPTDFKTVEELMGGLMGGAMQTPGLDPSAESDFNVMMDSSGAAKSPSAVPAPVHAPSKK